MRNQKGHALSEHNESKGFAPILIVLIMAALAFGGFYIYSTQKAQRPQRLEKTVQPIKPTQAPYPTPIFKEIKPTTDGNGWKRYQLEDFGMEFALPAKLSSLGTLKQEENEGGEGKVRGTIICTKFYKNKLSLINTVYAGAVGACYPNEEDKFLLGGQSLGYSAGRDRTFTDFIGYTITQNKYFLWDKEIENDLVTKIVNKNGVEILKIKGKNYDSSAGASVGYPVIGTPGQGWIGAYINTKNNKYPGLAIQAKLDYISETEFDQILSTFKFTDQNQINNDGEVIQNLVSSTWRKNIQAPANIDLVISKVKIEGEYATVDAYEKTSNTGETVSSEGILILAKKISGAWNLAYKGTATYNTWLDAIPEKLIRSDLKPLLK